MNMNETDFNFLLAVVKSLKQYYLAISPIILFNQSLFTLLKGLTHRQADYEKKEKNVYTSRNSRCKCEERI